MTAALPPRSAIDHSPGRSQRWDDVDDDIRSWVDAIAGVVGEPDGVVGVYLHGSLAMGCFHRPKSDLDLLVVVDRPLTADDSAALACGLLPLVDDRPIIGGLELSVVQRAAVERFVHPAPFDFHIGDDRIEHLRRGGAAPRGVDPDLAAHCTVTRARGLALVGPPPADVFGPVPRPHYLDAILDDLAWIVDGGILESPYYGVLNICRCGQVVLDDADVPPSKDEGARWALDHLSEHREVVAAALECYRAAASVRPEHRRHHGHRWDDEPLLALADWARRAILSR